MRAFRSFVVVLLLSVLVVGRVHAVVMADVCNETDGGLWVAFAYAGDSGWTTTGWWWADPNGCTGPVELATDAKEIYVHANDETGALEWQGTESLCVSLDSFEDDGSDTAYCEQKRSFQKHAATNSSVNVTLRAEDAIRIGYELTICNKTDEPVNTSLGNATGEGVSTDGWYGIESGECQTFVRRGKSDSAYVYAQTIDRRLVWRGDVALCAKSPDGFVLDRADSAACRDGDSERLPFVKKPLVKGRGSHDLEASKARAFKYGLNLCNDYKEDVYPAVAHLDGVGMNGMVARGFWRVRPGECRLVDAVGAGPVYIYAETDAIDKTWDGKDLDGCVRNLAFTFPNVDRHTCAGEGERRAGFFKWDVSEGANVYKFE